MTTLSQPLRAFARHNDPLLAAGINAALGVAPGIEVVLAADNSSFPDAEVVRATSTLDQRGASRHSTEESGAEDALRGWREREHAEHQFQSVEKGGRRGPGRRASGRSAAAVAIAGRRHPRRIPGRAVSSGKGSRLRGSAQARELERQLAHRPSAS